MLHLTIPFEEKPKTNLPGDNLRYYRLRKRLTTRQLAEQIDVVPATILMYEQNRHPIPYDVANAFSKALEVDAGILYDDLADFLAAPYSEALKSIRLAPGMSQKAFAEHIGIIPSFTNSKQGIADPPGRSI
ncbi:MAG: helix-turn-helix domain-containing protein [Lachnospiraceae bacterium]|nr:helix-turn-helix domain-containing protein [Lachnospiraceae bacterium]